MNAPEVAVASPLQMLPLALIAPSKTNPRKTFDPAALDELADSIRTQGVIQPILVRPRAPATGASAAYELVAGERRLRAAKAAGLDVIPALVRELTDLQALELQVIENLQRADLHPLEEAEGYEQLIDKHRLTVEDLVAKVGKSKAYIYARLKLTALAPVARKAFYAGELTPSTALLIARIPVAMVQAEALKRVKRGYGEPMSYRQAADTIHREFMLRLQDAPFARDDADLVAGAGTCAACPKRTGNQPELFGDVQSADICTDPVCFAAKRTAHFARVRAAAEAAGRKVISGKDAEKLIPAYSSGSYIENHARVNESIYVDGKSHKVAALVKKTGVETKLVEVPKTGELVEVVAKGALQAALKRAGLVKESSAADPAKKRKDAKAKAEAETEFRERVFSSIRGRLTANGKVTREDGVLVAGALWDCVGFTSQQRLAINWGWAASKNDAKSTHRGLSWEVVQKCRARIAELQPDELWRVMIELALDEQIHEVEKPTELLEAAERHGVDVEALRKELQAEAKAKTPASKPQRLRKAKASAEAST